MIIMEKRPLPGQYDLQSVQLALSVWKDLEQLLGWVERQAVSCESKSSSRFKSIADHRQPVEL